MNESEPANDGVLPPELPPVSLTGDDLLPPVEPPNASFILQLFVVPALIVMMIVGVWLVFSWLAHRTSGDPADLIQGLQGSSVARWQRASELADMLRNERYASLKHDQVVATQLAELLDREIDAATSAGGMSDEAVTLRYFLCRALGEFEVVDGTDVLIKAATTDRDPMEQVVRRGAIQAIAVRAFHLMQDDPQALDQTNVVPTLLQLASDSDPLVRSEVAFTLGRVGTPECFERLALMVEDPHSDTRYNASVALADAGNDAGVETLTEMLDIDELAGVDNEPRVDDQFAKRALIVSSAIDAVKELARQNPAANLSDVEDALERIAAADADQLEQARMYSVTVSAARDTLKTLQASP